MTASPQTLQQIEYALRKAAQKFPATAEPLPATDILIQVSPESGEMRFFDEAEHELTRCVVEEWIGKDEADFLSDVAELLRTELRRLEDVASAFNVVRPYAFVLIDDEGETVGDLFLADGDTIVLSGALMEGLEDDLNAFFSQLMAEDDAAH